MSTHIQQIAALAGTYSGRGINHEDEPFTGSLTLTPVVGGRGVALSFRAEGDDGTVFHEEHSVIASSGAGEPGLWTLDSHSGVMARMALARTAVDDPSRRSFVFAYGDRDDPASYRVEITLSAWANGDVGYDYAWGLPGGEFAARSAVRMEARAQG